MEEIKRSILRGLKEVKGKYIIIGDSDNTYDFYDIPIFLKLLRDGHDFVMGSRFKGRIKKGAMSWTHRYIGNPILSFLCRLFFRTSLSDIHCGMRAMTLEALKRINLASASWEYASEMTLKSVLLKLKK